MYTPRILYLKQKINLSLNKKKKLIKIIVKGTYRLLNLDDIFEKKLVLPEWGDSPAAPPAG